MISNETLFKDVVSISSVRKILLRLLTVIMVVLYYIVTCFNQIPDQVGDDGVGIYSRHCRLDRQSLEHQDFIIAEVVISRSYDLFSWLEALQDFVELRVLSADPDLALHCLAALRRYDIYPFASGLLIEGASWDKYGTFRLTEL